MTYTKHIGRNIHEQRKHASLTQTELAQKIGGSQRAISKLESGAVDPKVAHLILIADACACSIADLLHGVTARAVRTAIQNRQPSPGDTVPNPAKRKATKTTPKPTPKASGRSPKRPNSRSARPTAANN